jgi:hypothetical protein
MIICDMIHVEIMKRPSLNIYLVSDLVFELPATVLTPAATTSTVVLTTVAPTLTAVAAVETAASVTATTVHPLQNMQIRMVKR